MKKILGIELGSTRIKSVLIDEKANVLAQGAYEWENELVDGLWSYSLEKVEEGLQASYADLIKNYGEPIKKVDAIGISGMMHGYLAFDKELYQTKACADFVEILIASICCFKDAICPVWSASRRLFSSSIIRSYFLHPDSRKMTAIAST